MANDEQTPPEMLSAGTVPAPIQAFAAASEELAAVVREQLATP